MVILQIIKRKKVLYVTLILPGHKLARNYTVYGLKYDKIYHKTYAGEAAYASVYHTDAEIFTSQVKLGKTDMNGTLSKSIYLHEFYSILFVSPEGEKTVRSANNILQSPNKNLQSILVYLDK